MKTLEEVRSIFADDKFATENYAVIDEIGDKYAQCSVELCGRHRNAMGGVMGGVYFTLADYAFAVASNHEKMGVVSISSNIAFLSPCKGSKLIAKAVCQKDGRTTCYYTVDVYDDLGAHVAAVTITGCHVG